MSLDSPRTDAELLALLAQRTGKSPRVAIDLGAPQGDRSVVVPSSGLFLRIPWSALISDNDKFVAGLKGPKPVMRIRREYAEAKARIAQFAAEMMAGRPPLAMPVSLTARVWFPGNRTNDVTNWCKLVHDALQDTVLENDRWIHDARWIRAGVDVDAPRAEITIRPL